MTGAGSFVKIFNHVLENEKFLLRKSDTARVQAHIAVIFNIPNNMKELKWIYRDEFVVLPEAPHYWGENHSGLIRKKRDRPLGSMTLQNNQPTQL